MSARAQIASALASVGVLALGWQVSTASGHTLIKPTTTNSGKSTTTTSGKSTTTNSGSTSKAASSSAASSSSGSATGLKSGTFQGATASERYGDVQVTITVASGKVAAVDAATNSNDGHSQQINSYAVPVLKSETLSAQSASVSTVSGATYTSGAYLSSLQSALDQAAA